MFSCPQPGELVAVVGDAEPVLERLEVDMDSVDIRYYELILYIYSIQCVFAV